DLRELLVEDPAHAFSTVVGADADELNVSGALGALGDEAEEKPDEIARFVDDEGMLAELVEEDRMRREAARGSTPPRVEDLDDAIEIGLGEGSGLHGVAAS